MLGTGGTPFTIDEHTLASGFSALPVVAPQTEAQVRASGPKADRMSLIVFSGTVDKLLAASILTAGAAAMGMEVDLFLTTWGIEAFRKGAYATNTRVSKDFEEYGSVMNELLQAKKAATWMDNLRGAKEIGTVTIFACSMTMELFGIKREDLEPIVDDVTGVAEFIERARDSKITLFI